MISRKSYLNRLRYIIIFQFNFPATFQRSADREITSKPMSGLPAHNQAYLSTRKPITRSRVNLIGTILNNRINIQRTTEHHNPIITDG